MAHCIHIQTYNYKYSQKGMFSVNIKNCQYPAKHVHVLISRTMCIISIYRPLMLLINLSLALDIFTNIYYIHVCTNNLSIFTFHYRTFY